MNIKRIIIPLLLILFMASIAAFGAPVYVNVGPTTEFDGDIKILSEIVAEGTTADGWETTVFFTDPTADRTITIPDADVTVGVVTGIVPPDHGGTGIANNVASTITITGAFATTITVSNVTTVTLPTSGIIVSDNNACTDIEGTGLSIAGGVLNWACTVNGIDSDNYTDGSIDHEHLAADVIHGLTVDTLAAADEFMFYDETGAHLNKITWTNLMGSITKVGTIGTGTWEGTAIADGFVAGAAGWDAKAASGANTDITSILNVALYVGRDLDNRISWATDDRLIIEIANVIHTFLDIETGVANNDSLVTQGYVDDAAAGGGANLALSNLAAVAINLSLVSDAADTYDLGSTTKEWLNLYLGTYGTVYFGTAQTENIAETAVNELTITSITVAIAGTLAMGANNITSTGYIGRDADNYLSWDTDNTLKIEINNVLHSIVSITNGVANNDKLATQGYVDDQVAGANVNLSNLAAVAINTTLISDAADTYDLGSVTKEWRSLYIGEAGKIYLRLDQSVNLQATGAGILTITAANGVVTSAALTVGGTLALAANNLTMTGSIGVTGSRVTKLWATDLEVTNAIAGSITGTARGLVSVSNGDITIQPNGTGDTIIYAPADVVTTKTAVATLTIAEAGTVLVSCAATPYTITLPTAVGHSGLRYHFIKTDANYFLITLDGNAAETLNYENSTGAPVATYARLNTYCAEVTIVSDGTNWQVINERMGQNPMASAYLGAQMNNITDSIWVPAELDTEDYDIGSNFNTSTWVSGNATSTSANHLVDAGGTFTAEMVGKRVKNTTDSTYTYITVLNSATDVTVGDDIFVDTEGYEIKYARYIVPVSGKYLIIASLGWISLIADKRYFTGIYVNGSAISKVCLHTSHTMGIYASGSVVESLSKDDYIQLRGLNTSGGNTSDIVGTADQTYLCIKLISKD